MTDIDTILFDLDGTLLPMDMQAFERHYGETVASYVGRHGHDVPSFMKALFVGTERMKANDGTRTNAQCFEETFSKLYAPYDDAMDAFIRAFFDSDHYIALNTLTPDPFADKLIKKAKALGYTVVLATNPYSPQPATNARMKAAGLDKDDFTLITTMENSTFCKPNLGYFLELLLKIQKRPQDCLVVGNDVAEDMIAEKIGCSTYLVTPCLINKYCEDIGRFEKGTLEDLYHRLKPIL